MNAPDSPATRTLLVLGWSDILAQVALACRTLAGARAAVEITLLSDASAVRGVYASVRELGELERGGLRCPVGAVNDIGPAVERAGRGLTLEMEDLRAVGSGLEGLHILRRWAESVAEEAPAVFGIAHPIEVDNELAQLLRRSFDAVGQLSGKEYPQLEELRRRRESLKSRIHTTLDELMRDDGLGAVLQDRYFTERNGRYVLPVKSSFRKGIGIVHGTSQSGETVYIEPAAVVELHNDLTEAEASLFREERRILGELSDRVGRGRTPILRSLAAAVRLDLICARVTFGARLGATIPSVHTEGVITVVDARHPLLAFNAIPSAENPNPRAVVANDLSLTPQAPGLVLTGPNAGGKTVALKTLGLFALLVRAGLPVPAAAGARVDLFDPIFADIGDQQSVQEGLSTFSAHVRSLTHAVALTAAAAPGAALVLIDEITAGTDPSQGAALARAVVERLVDNGARVAVTTHFPEMKALAAADARFAVAAAQFADGKPTFRLETGSPGPSHAMAIARRMGMPPAVLDRAVAVMDEASRALSQQLEALDEERGRARLQTERLASERAEMTLRLEELTAREAVLQRRIDRAVAEEVDKARVRLRAREDEVRALVAGLQANPEMRAANEALRQVREVGAALSEPDAGGSGEPLSSSVSGPAAPVVVFSAGQRVRHRTLGIVDIVEVGGDKIRISLRGMLSWVPARDLQEIGGAKPIGGKPSKVDTRHHREVHPSARPRPGARPDASRESAETTGVHVAMAHNTIDLRGFRVEDAFPAIEQFFDGLSNRSSVGFILHGHGTGALKVGVRQWLSSSAYVRDFRPANIEEGGDALTVVRFRE
jgi:DNA mismatch repair protein MutS2